MRFHPSAGILTQIVEFVSETTITRDKCRSNSKRVSKKMLIIIFHLFQVDFNFGCLFRLHKHAWIKHFQYISERKTE